MRRAGPHSPLAGGFTIMELMIVAAIFGLIMVGATASLRNLTRADLRSAAGRTAGAMRYVFDRAAMTGHYLRLAIDIKEGRIWIEYSEDLVRLRAGREQHVLEKGEKDASGEARDKLREAAAGRKGGTDFLGSMLGLGGDEEYDEDGNLLEDEQEFPGGLDGKQIAAEAELANMPVVRPKASFKPLQNVVARVIKLKGGVKVASVITPRLSEAIKDGMAYVYFFPQGHSEPAIIYFTDGEEEKVYSVVLHPLTGRAVVFACEYEVPDDFGVSDDKRKSGKREACKQGGSY